MTLYVNRPLNDTHLSILHDAISSASARQTVSPVTGRIVGIWGVSNGVIGAAGGVYLSINGSSVANSSFSVSSGAAGTVTGPITNGMGPNSAMVTEGQAISITSDGTVTSSNFPSVNFVLVIRR